MQEKLWTKNFILACTTNFFMAFAFYLLMPTLPLYLTAELKLPESDVGMVLSTYTLATLLSRLFSGYLVDKFPRKTLLLVGIALFSLTFFGYMFAASIAAFMGLRFIHGATWGVASVSSSTVAIDIVPSAKRGQGIGYYGLSLNLSMALAPWVALAIYNKLGYFSLLVCCLLAGFAALLTASFIKTKYRPKVEEKRPISFDRFILVRALPISLNLVLCAISYGVIVSYGVLYGKEINIENAGMLFVFMGAGIGLSRIISGRYVDKGHLHRIAILSLSLLTISLTVFALVHSIEVFCAMALLCGVSFGTMIPAFQTLFVTMAHHNQRGTANSTYLTSFDLGIGGGMLLGGFLASRTNLSTAFLFSAGLCFISVPYYYFISQRVYEKRKLVPQ